MTEPRTWCTDWRAYDVPRLWEMVSAEDSREAWAQVSAWFRLRDAVDDQRERLAACRQALVELWPPERSEASAAFVAVLDELVDSMTKTVQAAASTAGGLAGVLQSLATAKAEIKPLYDDWVTKSNDLTPRWLDHAEDELNNKARAAMAKAEQAVADYTPMIQPPPKYELRARRDPPPPPTDVGDPFRTPSRAELLLGSPAPTPPIPHLPPLPLPDSNPFGPNEPVLAGGPPPPSAVSPPLSGLPTPSGIAASPSVVPAPAPESWLIPTPRGLALAPGGVIGPTSSPPPTATPVRSTPPGSVAARGPVPGLVAPGPIPQAGATAAAGAAAGPSGNRRTPTPSPVVSGTGYRTPDGHVVTVSGPGVRFGHPPQAASVNPFDPWAVGEGVPPIIAPDSPRQHDPGPGIIGMDR